MKNIFKFMGVALLATSMLVACSKDNKDEGGSTSYGDPTVTITFDGQNVGTIGSIQAGYYASYGINAFDFFAAAQTYPGVEIYTGLTAAGQGTATFDASSLSLNGEPSVCEYYEETSLSDGQYTYGDWWAAQASINMTNYDLTNTRLSFTLDATMFWAREAFVESYGAVGYEAATRKPMTVNAKDILFTQN